MKRDDIIAKPATGFGSPKNVSADRIKSISGGGPAFVANDRSSAPAPSNPYGKK